MIIIKKLCLIVIMIFSVTVFASCGGTTVTPKTEGFSADADVVFQGHSFSCKIQAEGTESFSVTMTAPKTLDGMKFCWDGDDFSLSYLGIDADISESELPVSQFAKIFKNALYLTKRSGAAAEKSGSEYCTKGEIDGNDYKLYVRADGFPIKFSVPSAQLEITFKNIEYIF